MNSNASTEHLVSSGRFRIDDNALRRCLPFPEHGPVEMTGWKSEQETVNWFKVLGWLGFIIAAVCGKI